MRKGNINSAIKLLAGNIQNGIRKNIFACLFTIHNTISLSRHEQVCLSGLRFERYFSRWWEKYISKSSPLKHTCSWRDKLIVLCKMVFFHKLIKPCIRWSKNTRMVKTHIQKYCYQIYQREEIQPIKFHSIDAESVKKAILKKLKLQHDPLVLM